MANARDAELERLATAQELAFQRSQETYGAMQRLWESRSSARDAMNRAYEAKQHAYAEFDRTWQRYQNVRNAHGPRIDSLNVQQETAYENMRRSFDAASAAFERRDGASAKSLAADGHRYKAESQQCVAERRQLVEEIKSGRARHEAAKPAFERAKEHFHTAKQAYNRVKAEHERAQADFKQCKVEAEKAKEAFHKRLAQLKEQSKKRQDEKRTVAEKAGIPFSYRDNVWISRDSHGNINIYFGGAGKPNGPGHGHYVMDRNGNLTYKRDPFDPHGSQNFEQAEEGGLLYIRSARSNHEPLGTNEHGGVFYRRSDNGNTKLHITQYFDDGYRVSWNATAFGTHDIHWTNQRVSSGDPRRHVPPSDAVLKDNENR